MRSRYIIREIQKTEEKNLDNAKLLFHIDIVVLFTRFDTHRKLLIIKLDFDRESITGCFFSLNIIFTFQPHHCLRFQDTRLAVAGLDCSQEVVSSHPIRHPGTLGSYHPEQTLIDHMDFS